jgi:hypothetical protein
MWQTRTLYCKTSFNFYVRKNSNFATGVPASLIITEYLNFSAYDTRWLFQQTHFNKWLHFLLNCFKLWSKVFHKTVPSTSNCHILTSLLYPLAVYCLIVWIMDVINCCVEFNFAVWSHQKLCLKLFPHSRVYNVTVVPRRACMVELSFGTYCVCVCNSLSLCFIIIQLLW